MSFIHLKIQPFENKWNYLKKENEYVVKFKPSAGSMTLIIENVATNVSFK